MTAIPLRTITPTVARRLALYRQHLAGPRLAPDATNLYAVLQDLRCLQLDPISAVARSHLLVLWSRLGLFNLGHLDTLLWEERRLFEYWAHCASLVLTEDYPLHADRMRSQREGRARRERTVLWYAEHMALREHILSELAQHGPLGSHHFIDGSVSGWHSSGWTSERTVSQMIDVLWMRGEIMVARRKGGQRLWDLAPRCLPANTPLDGLPEREVTRRAALLALRALGVARPAHIRQHFTRGRYSALAEVLHTLEAEGAIEQVEIGDAQGAWPGPWFVHATDVPLLQRLADGEWHPRTTFLSPFDNLICDRARTLQLFGFDFRNEIYTPKERRRFGYYVLPILQGDRLIGRVDPFFDRKEALLRIRAIHLEAGVRATKKLRQELDRTFAELAAFVGAREIAFDASAATLWRS